jgi:hypothetical protein
MTEKTVQQHCKEIAPLGARAKNAKMTKEELKAHMEKMSEASKLARIRRKIEQESKKKVEEEAIKSMIN